MTHFLSRFLTQKTRPHGTRCAQPGFASNPRRFLCQKPAVPKLEAWIAGATAPIGKKKIRLGIYGMRGWIARRVALLTVVGCDRNELYGRHDSYVQYIDYAIEVDMPPEAPFISEQFRKGTETGTNAHPGMDVWAPFRTPILAAADVWQSGRNLTWS